MCLAMFLAAGFPHCPLPVPRELSHNRIEGLPSLHGCQKLEEM